ncbi:hypothetical protein [Prosthecobacter fluviatilis]|uniref:Uncharacterized protein n=1 Tax=Prosthecobacter fluviatilis TaxID=445931 RepID=A0ABW0KPC7_9BACT
MSSEPKHPTAEQLKRAAIWGIVIIVALWALSGFLITWGSSNPGTFGDMFGAVNALFSGLAFLGVIFAIVLQYQELKEQRMEIELSRIAQQESAKALTAQLRAAETRSRLDSLNLLIEAQRRILDRIGEGDTIAEAKLRTKLERRIAGYETKLERLLENEIEHYKKEAS